MCKPQKCAANSLVSDQMKPLFNGFLKTIVWLRRFPCCHWTASFLWRDLRDQSFYFSLSFGTGVLQTNPESKHLSSLNTIPFLGVHSSRDWFASRVGKYAVKCCNASSTQILCFAISTKLLSCLFFLTKQVAHFSFAKFYQTLLYVTFLRNVQASLKFFFMTLKR